MTPFWSVFITAITVGTLIGCAALLFWCNQPLDGVDDGEDMGHDYDGIRELNNPLPKWWSYLFWSTLFFAVIYLLLYPGLGNFTGLFHWQSSDQDLQSLAQDAQLPPAPSVGINQYQRELAFADQKFDETYRKLTYLSGHDDMLSIPTIAQNPEAMKVAQRIFIQNCAQCHGSDARGQAGFPNLTDNAWLYGGAPLAIKRSIEQGRIGTMPAWITAFGADGVSEVAAYTLSLSGRKVDAQQAAKGQKRFAVCAACHASDGTGSSIFGAPDLTDNVWLFGGSRQAVEQSIANGRQATMPAWNTILDPEKIQLLSAYVWKQSQPQTQ